MIRNLIFDMGGVILPMQSIEEPMRRFAQLGLTRNQAEQCFGLYGQQGIFREAETGERSAEAFLEAYRELTGRATTFDEVSWAWLGFVHEPPVERLHELDRLRGEGYHVALLSNTNPFIMRHCESPAFSPLGKGIASHFDRLFYSYRLGACKPDPSAFERMLQQGGYVAAESLFLDDAMHNVEAARALGMHALHVPENRDWAQPLRRYLAEFGR